MKIDEVSYGVIPVAFDREGSLHVYMVQHRFGEHWSFPKGHAEARELPRETAQRELFEETSLKIRSWLPLPPEEESYQIRRGESGRIIHKMVRYYYAILQQGLDLPAVSLCEKELISGEFVPSDRLEGYACFPEARRLFLNAALRLALPGLCAKSRL